MKFNPNTSIPQSLFPKNSTYVFNPSLLDVGIGRLHNDRLIGFTFPKPNLKASARVAHFSRETNVGRLHALLVDVNVQILNFIKAINDKFLHENCNILCFSNLSFRIAF